MPCLPLDRPRRLVGPRAKRAPAWSEREVLALLGLWGKDAVQARLRSNRRNLVVYEQISRAMVERGFHRDVQQCRAKAKELRQAYHKAGFSCPQCRETAPRRDLPCSRELASLVELVKQLVLPAKPEEQSQCETQGEPRKRSCPEERQVVCVGCRESGVPPVVPTEEAAQTYKAQIKARLQALKAEREKLLRLTETGKICWEYLEKIERERQSIGAEFQHFRQFLAEQERLLLAPASGSL
nr:E3 ubiquitin-protein ligase TRIM11-like [Pelodiscus sinensis]|eukprot:XP_025040454.1 E3 ubiquitin-protein ligase TRIM11-like [Pelodiscus sinensis]